VFLLIDAFISAFAVIRYYERLNDMAPKNAFDRIMDKYYPNTRVAKIYPNIRDSKTHVKLIKMK